MDEKHFEQASALEARLRQQAQDEVQRRMQGNGCADCEDCDDPIPRERRLAVPNAIRCICCQTRHERTTRGMA